MAVSDIRFGFCVPNFALPGVGLFRTPGYAELHPATTMALGRAAEELGYDSLWVADHLMLGQDDAILEGWTTLAALAGATQRVRLGMIHQANGFRHPALAAKMAATLDQISGGRLIHFIDGGTQRREHLAYGLPWSDDSAERIARMREGLELTLALWTADRPVSFAGAHYRVESAVCAPRPLQKPHPPVWFGEAHPAILETCAQYGQGWNSTPVALPELRGRLAALAEACARVGRPFRELEKSLEIQILVAPDRAALRQRLHDIIALAPADQSLDADLRALLDGETDELPATFAQTWICGTPDEAAQRIREYVAAGITHFMLWFVDAPRLDGMQLFAEQIAPRFRCA
jgi:alkanesulfonate monooxygenase SsuD/methylene tetrahydromethanopterin reductase-like flavin-dependent oxidoreductase (luciferase family)